MKRLTIGADACTETLALLITMAWADGRLDDNEKEGVLAAAEVFNLTKELRERLDQILQKPMPVEELLVENLSARDKAFAFVAAVVDERRRLRGRREGEAAPRQGRRSPRPQRGAQDRARARSPATSSRSRKGEGSWTKEIVTLFKAIPQRLEGDGEFEVAFE